MKIKDGKDCKKLSFIFNLTIKPKIIKIVSPSAANMPTLDIDKPDIKPKAPITWSTPVR